MTEYEKYSLLLNIIYVVATLLLAALALWGEKIRQIWTKPRLSIDLDEPTLTSHTDGKDGWYYHIRVKNSRKSTPARNVRVLLCAVFKKGPDGEWHERKFSGPVQALWRWPQYAPQYATVGPDEHSTFGCLREDSNSFQIQLYWTPLNLNCAIIPNDPTKLQFKAVSDTAESSML